MQEQKTVERALAEFGASHPLTADQLLPLLHAVQRAYGHIPADAVGLIAQTLNLSRADVFGVISFYADFLDEPRAVSVEICGAEACQALGCRALLAEVSAMRGSKAIVSEVFCLGNCAVGPSARVGDKIIGRATLERIAAAIGAGSNA